LGNRLLVATVGRDVGLVQPRPVDVDVAPLLAPTLAGEGDDALDVDDVRIADEAAGGCGSVRSVERGDVARRGSRNRYVKRETSTRSIRSASHPAPGRAQWNVSSIAELGMR
jgi:hypothetical protein